jgi:hypothetical protein
MPIFTAAGVLLHFSKKSVGYISIAYENIS